MNYFNKQAGQSLLVRPDNVTMILYNKHTVESGFGEQLKIVYL